MLWFPCLLLVGAGCYSSEPERPCTVTCGGSDDPGLCPDGFTCMPDGVCRNPDGTCDQCYGQLGGLVRVCVADAPTKQITYDQAAGQTIDTTAQQDCTLYAPTSDPADEVCVVVAESIEVTTAVRAVGKLPLVLVAASTLHVGPGGLLDASSALGTRGAGSPGTQCVAGLAPAGFGHDGGAGGGFGSVGGDGGADGMSGNGGAAGSVAPPLQSVVAGCDGQTGADEGRNEPGNAGEGGGALYLIAGDTLTLDGVVNASGGGGPPPLSIGQRGGGRGGGAGGLIGLDAPMLIVRGRILANGGGGSSGNTVGQGTPGGDPVEVGVAAPGGAIAACGTTGVGGNGAAVAPSGAVFAATRGGNGDANCGGGGGGGGLGVVWQVASSVDLSGGQVSPAPQMH